MINPTSPLRTTTNVKVLNTKFRNVSVENLSAVLEMRLNKKSKQKVNETAQKTVV